MNEKPNGSIQPRHKSEAIAVEMAFVDQGYTGETAAKEAQAYGIRLEVLKLYGSEKRFCVVATPMGG